MNEMLKGRKSFEQLQWWRTEGAREGRKGRQCSWPYRSLAATELDKFLLIGRRHREPSVGYCLTVEGCRNSLHDLWFHRGIVTNVNTEISDDFRKPTRSEPTRMGADCNWFWWLAEVHHRTSVFALCNCRWLKRIQAATSAMHKWCDPGVKTF